jgi:hypothetical protein
MIFDPSVLPAGLPEPEDDGAASHLAGRPMPDLALPSTSGGRVRVDLVPEGADRLLIYAYPRTGRPESRRSRPTGTSFLVHAAARLSLAASATMQRTFGMRARPWPGSRRSRRRTSLKWSRGWVCPSRF